MNIYTCTEFTGHYPTGVAAIVLAKSKAIAKNRLNKELQNCNLPGDAKVEDIKHLCRAYTQFDLCRLTPKSPVVILADGNY